MDHQIFCRICGSEDNLEVIARNGDDVILVMIRAIGISMVVQADRVPGYICLECKHMLKETYNFKMLYEATYHKFKEKCLEDKWSITSTDGLFVIASKSSDVSEIKYEMPRESGTEKSYPFISDFSLLVKEETCIRYQMYTALKNGEMETVKDRRKPPKSASQRNKEYRERKKLNRTDPVQKPPPKSNSQRSKEYRERKKWIKADSTPNAQPKAPKAPPKSASQRNKEYRERKKLKRVDSTPKTPRKTPPKSNSQRCKEYRERRKLRQLQRLLSHILFGADGEEEIPRNKHENSNVDTTKLENLAEVYHTPPNNINNNNELNRSNLIQSFNSQHYQIDDQ